MKKGAYYQKLSEITYVSFPEERSLNPSLL